MMKRYKWVLMTMILLSTQVHLDGQTQATISVIESTGGCMLATDCDNNVICVDLVLTLDATDFVDSYNLWVTYDQSVISRRSLAPNDNSGAGDNSCIIANGAQDTDDEDTGAWRVAGVPGSPVEVMANTPTTIHTICFEILDAMTLDGAEVCAGGDQFFGIIKSTVTYQNATFDDNISINCLTLDNSFESCSILPVELTSFTAEKKREAALLNWVTSSEVNNDYFEVQHSADGNDYETIGMVAGNGTTSESQYYDYSHGNPVNGINYYRLKQVDYDGAHEYSEVRTVRFEGLNTELSVFPNPTSDYLTVKSGRDLKDHNAYVYDLAGRLVGQVDLDQSKRIDLSDYESGMYMLRISDQSGREVLTQSVVKI